MACALKTESPFSNFFLFCFWAKAGSYAYFWLSVNLSAKPQLVWRYWWEASELDRMESTIEQLIVQSTIGMAIAGKMEGCCREKSESEVRLWSQSSLRSVPLNPIIPLFLFLLTIMPESNFRSDIFYGYWCLFFIFFLSFLSPLAVLFYFLWAFSCHAVWFFADGCSECVPEWNFLSGGSKAAGLQLQPTTARCNQCF